MKYIKVILPIIFSFLISPLFSKSYEFKTPLVKKNWKALTSYNEMIDYLKKKDRKRILEKLNLLLIPMVNVETEKFRSKTKFPAGSVFIPSKQPAALLIPLLLEPESSVGLVSRKSGRKYRFINYLQEGSVFPVKRIPSKVKLQLEEIKD